MVAIRQATILLVDDDERVRSIMSDALRNAGYEVLIARHGLDALDVALHASRVDLVVTDVKLPGMDGLRLLGRLRARYPDLAAVVISGYPEFEPPVATLRTATAFLDKPFTGMDLVRVVDGLLRDHAEGESEPDEPS